jgi:hypothetical protein
MTKKKQDRLATPVPAEKWEAKRQAERIEPKTIPHLNSTMRGAYVASDLSYRGMRQT